jgi:hypothetical protein
MADIVPAWMWRDPGEIIDELLSRSARQAARAQGLDVGRADSVSRPQRDRYYTQARRVHLQQIMRGRR